MTTQSGVIKLKFDNSYNGRLFAVQGDTGRLIKVQVLDDHSNVVDVTDLSLRLYVGNSKEVVYSDGQITDAENGRFEINLYNNQLKHPGMSKAQFILTDSNGQKIGSKIMDLYVEEGLETGATVGVNTVVDFGKITETLDLLKNYETTLEESKKIDLSLKVGINEGAEQVNKIKQAKQESEDTLSNLNNTINQATQIDGEIKQKTDVIDGWIADPSQFKGDKGDTGDTGPEGPPGPIGPPGPASKVTDTGKDPQGNTTVTFNDGTTITVEKGADGTMSFDDLTQEQKESLKGADGQRGTLIFWFNREVNGKTATIYGTDKDFLEPDWEAMKPRDKIVTKNGSLYEVVSAIPRQANLKLINNLIGPQGPVGPQGPPGADGQRGQRGPQGPPGDPATNIVKSVNGKTGTVNITKADVGLGNVTNIGIKFVTKAERERMSQEELNNPNYIIATYED